MKQAYLLALLSALTLAAVPAGVAADEGSNIPLPAGTELQVRLTSALSTKNSDNGDPWVGRVIEPIFAQGREVVPASSRVDGHITYLKPAGRTVGTGEMRIVADTITTPGEGTFTIVASLEDAQGADGAKVKDEEGTIKGPGKDAKGAAKEAGIGAAVGAGVGVMTAGGTGALYGAGIGVVAAAIHSLAKKHKGVVLPPGTEMTFVLSRASLSKQVPAPRPNPSSP
jgi:hypothetical protein